MFKNALFLAIFQVIKATSMKMTASWEILPLNLAENQRFGDASIIRAIIPMMQAVHTSEMSVYLYETTRPHIPEGYHLHITPHPLVARDNSIACTNFILSPFV
jgi:hypothetical protein